MKIVAALLILPLVGGCSAAATSAVTHTGSEPVSVSPPSQDSLPELAKPDEPFDRSRHSLTDPRSTWVIVNKAHPISPSDFEPKFTIVRGYQVASPAAAPLAHLLRAADRAGIHLKIASAFRSYGYQESLHASLAATLGLAGADTVSARAGYSEHQTGLAVDLQPLDGTCAVQACFARTAAGRWLAAHAWTFGFIDRYTAANTRVTGYSPEPWHFRYVGKPLARELHRTGVGSLEQFFGVRGGDYAR